MQWLNKFATREDMIIAGATFGVTFGVYFLTMCPTIYWEDSAAFCAANSTLGIPHSPGFPIYVLLGRVFSLVPIQNPAFRSNLMSAFWGSLSLMILYLLMLEFLKEKKSFHRVICWCSSPAEKNWVARIGMLGGTLFFGFSSAYWLQTIRAEVYTLNIFFTLLLIFLGIKWLKEKESYQSFKILILFSFVLGISFANHPLLIGTLLPAFLLFGVINDFKHFGDFKKIMLLSSFLLLGISLYLFLPIRSNLSPAINWGRPDSLGDFFSYLTRYSQSPPVETSSNIPYLNRFWFTLSFPVVQFGLPLFWLGVFGAYLVFKESKRVFTFTFLLFIFNLFTAAWATDFSLRNYDLLGYLLPSLSVFAIWFGLGLSFFLEIILTVNRTALKPIYFRVFLCGIIFLLPIYQIARNFSQCDKRSNSWAYQYADQILNSVKKDGLILVGDDNTLTTLWYLNHAEKKRPDVKIISASALSQKNYREQLAEQYEGVILPKIESESAQTIACDLCRLNMDKMPIYCQYYTNDTVFAHHLSPAGYIFEYHPERVVLSDLDIKMHKEFLENNLKNRSFDLITKEHFGNLVFNIGVFYNQMSVSTASLEYLLMALDIDPSNSRIYAHLGKAFLKMGEKHRAKEFFQAALELDPYNQDIKRALENI